LDGRGFYQEVPGVSNAKMNPTRGAWSILQKAESLGVAQMRLIKEIERRSGSIRMHAALAGDRDAQVSVEGAGPARRSRYAGGQLCRGIAASLIHLPLFQS
jgi:hypothetical protein